MFRKCVLIILLLAHIAAAADSPFSLGWSKPMNKGVHRIDLVSLSFTGVVEVYAISFDPSRTAITVYSIDGRELSTSVVPREAVGEYGDEDTMMATVTDLDGNRFLDIISATEIRVSSINNHRLYRHQRIPEEGLDRLYNRYVWMVKETGLVTSIHVIDLDNDNKQEIITSSVDDRIRAYNTDGMLLFNYTLSGSIWDNTPVNADDDDGIEYLAAGFKGLYLVDDNGSLIWSKPAEDRFDKAAAYDLDGDWKPELIGLSGGTVHVYDTDGGELWSYDAGNVKAIGSIGFEGIEDRQERHLLLGVDTKVLFLQPGGELAWEHEVGERVYSLNSVEYEGHVNLFVGTEDSIKSYSLGDYFKINKACIYYSKALSAYGEGEFNHSVYYSGRAAELYLELELIENETHARMLQSKAKNIWKAEDLLNTGEEHFKAGRYNESVNYARQALTIYTEVGYEQGITRSNDLQARGSDKADIKSRFDAAKREADEYYALAEDYYIKSSYSESLKYARLAYDRYSEIYDERGMELAETLVSMNDAMVAETTTTTVYLTLTTLRGGGRSEDDLMMYGSLAGIALIIVAVLAIRFRERRPTS